MFYDLISVQRCQQAVWAYVGRRARWAVEELLCAMMQSERDQFLGCQPHQRCAARRGYRNGHYVRCLQSRQGLLTLRVPRVRQCPEAFHTQVLVRYQRRCAEVDLAVLRWVGGGMSTRKAAGAFQQAFHGVLSAGTVSRIVARLDAQIRAFHSRSLHREGYRYVFFDAKHGYTCHRRRRRGRGKKKKGALLLAWAARHNGREELIDFRAVDNENEKNWTAFMTDLQRRGLKLQDQWGRDLEMIVSDGDGGLLEALYMVYPTVPKQRCVFHKIQNITDHLRDRNNRKAILTGAGAIYKDLTTVDQAKRRLQKWIDRWKDTEPHAARNFAYDFELTLTYLTAPVEWQSRVKTSNPIERFIKELNRKLKQIGIFPSPASWERCVWLVWKLLEATGYAPTSPDHPQTAFTQNT